MPVSVVVILKTTVERSWNIKKLFSEVSFKYAATSSLNLESNDES